MGNCFVKKISSDIFNSNYQMLYSELSEQEDLLDFLETKYPYVCHAELNAILNSIKSLKDCIIYVALFPCNECSKAIIQSGIKEIVYLSDKYDGTDTNRASKKMLDSAGVKYRQFTPNMDKLEIDFKNI